MECRGHFINKGTSRIQIFSYLQTASLVVRASRAWVAVYIPEVVPLTLPGWVSDLNFLWFCRSETILSWQTRRCFLKAKAPSSFGARKLAVALSSLSWNFHRQGTDGPRFRYHLLSVIINIGSQRGWLDFTIVLAFPVGHWGVLNPVFVGMWNLVGSPGWPSALMRQGRKKETIFWVPGSKLMAPRCSWREEDACSLALCLCKEEK